MAGYSRYTALLDACVLFPAATTDALMSLAAAGFFAAKWTQAIETEWIAALERQRPDLEGKLQTRRDCMREAVPDWEVPETAWGRLIGSFVLPDPNDRHVLAAAIAGHADCIVTSNRRDFPNAVASEYGIEIIDPDRFIVNQWDLDSISAMAAFKQMRARRKKPESSVEDFAQAMERSGLPSTAQRIREARELL
ncbi:PIN domain-containing protein [Pandoraea eparura]|jgi:predicted nucleic acid-binding protein|uniref:PIN domain-containing protein n=1 Tax=Pandoraea eparura TaxID=2508291 RepID=A0A5E4WEZ7_9BURK|nr:PIN domain-containing protein [Pandoraea eparura]VVE23402.1 PIN domain-containing protein [Pandoraea eparura]